ncbi:MAG: phosphate ABC transporter substrate-binding protein PstS family protein [Clostridia bacterium]|jgi:phosphate transport system substrate-binding protein|nr:phosphate ABC transporter substrate-binding protein PstS family protein [Clostridia bacterium]MDH7573953.1 phosphate ABC transporter substrate-binding protein PstS family protein [Clostridia bacterium]
MRKGLVVLLLLALVCCLVGPAAAARAADISVRVDGKELVLDSPPVLDQGRVLVPMRAVFEALGATVKWEAATQTVSGQKGNTSVILKVGQKQATVSGKSVALDAPARLVSGRVLVPLRFVAEALGASVSWDAAVRRVNITSQATATGSTAAAPLAGELKLSGSTSVQPLAEELAQAFMAKHPQVRISIAGGGSGVGVKDAAEGRVHIGNVSRAQKDGDPAGLVWTTIAKDGVAVIVHPSNPVSALTKEQVKKIFTGQITNWKDAGGGNAPIVVHSRTVPSGTYDFFVEAFLDKEEVVKTAKQHASNGLVRQAVASDKNAVGFISLGYLDASVKAPKMDGVEPTLDNARSGKYKYVRPFNLVTKGQPSGLAKAFLDFVLSTEGQEIVAREYIPVKYGL